jgi:hypothetical protein
VNRISSTPGPDRQQYRHGQHEGQARHADLTDLTHALHPDSLRGDRRPLTDRGEGSSTRTHRRRRRDDQDRAQRVTDPRRFLGSVNDG